MASWRTLFSLAPNWSQNVRLIAGNPHVEVTFKTGVAQLKPGQEFRAGFLDTQGNALLLRPGDDPSHSDQ